MLDSRMHGLVAALVVGAICLGPVSAESAVPEAAARCLTCHGASGNVASEQVPVIAGIGTFYLENQMLLFTDRARPCLVDFLPGHDAVDKCELMGALDESQQAAIAAYFGSFPYNPPAREVDAAKSTEGRRVHEEKCARCHTENGTEVLDDAALLAGQPVAYLERQLRRFQDGSRWQPPFMQRETEDLTAAQIEALAHFYAGVRPSPATP